MHWLAGLTAGICAGIAILAAVYGLNKINDWHEHRVVVLGEIATLEGDPGYPNRENNIRSAREQIDFMDRDVRNNALISAFVLALAIGAFVPLWRQAARSFSAMRLTALVAVTAAAGISAAALIVVMLSAGVIRG